MGYVNKRPFYSHAEYEKFRKNYSPMKEAAAGIFGFLLMCLMWAIMFFCLSSAIH